MPSEGLTETNLTPADGLVVLHVFVVGLVDSKVNMPHIVAGLSGLWVWRHEPEAEQQSL